MVSKFSQVRVIEGQFVPREPKLVRVIGSFEKSRVPEIGHEIIELEWSKSKGKKGLVRDIGRFGKPRVREIGIPLYIEKQQENTPGTT